MGSEKKSNHIRTRGRYALLLRNCGENGDFLRNSLKSSQTFVGFPNSEGRNFTIVERLRLVEMLFFGLQKPLECWDP